MKGTCTVNIKVKVDISDYTENQGLTVRSNPTSNQLRISLPNPSKGGANAAENAEYRIYSVIGQVVLQGNLQNNTISVESLANGMCYLEIDNKVVKFVKE